MNSEGRRHHAHLLHIPTDTIIATDWIGYIELYLEWIERPDLHTACKTMLSNVLTRIPGGPKDIPFLKCEFEIIVLEEY